MSIKLSQEKPEGPGFAHPRVRSVESSSGTAERKIWRSAPVRKSALRCHLANSYFLIIPICGPLSGPMHHCVILCGALHIDTQTICAKREVPEGFFWFFAMSCFGKILLKEERRNKLQFSLDSGLLIRYPSHQYLFPFS